MQEKLLIALVALIALLDLHMTATAILAAVVCAVVVAVLINRES
jgi:uncharacterized membrane protein YraQ (UPF0718 family)